jgi:hypothetical protein
MEKIIRKELESIADGKYRIFSSKLIPNVNNVLGVRLPELRKIAKRLAHDDYHVKIAVAWAVSIYCRDLPETGIHYLKNNQLDDWTHHKALQKITESLAIGDEAKRVIRSMKRKAGK